MSGEDRSNRDLESRLLDHVCRVQFEDLPEEEVACCKLFIMDSLGVTFPGSRAPGCAEVADLVKRWGGEGGSTVLIYGHKTPPGLAALANSTMMHALDFDDTLDDSALHTFVSVLPAALAAAESVGPVDGRRLITALVLGVDVICRLSLGIQRPLSWIRTATCGSFGAATTAGKLLGLDRHRMSNALGVAYSQTSGNAQGLLEGRLVKRMQPGFAAQAGVLAAFLAKVGITGSQRFLQGPYGFYNLYEQGEFDPDPVLDGLGTHYGIMDLSLKPYPCCRMTHATIDAALELGKVVGSCPGDIEAVQVTVSKMVTEMVGKPFVIGTDPQVDAQFSIPYTASAALVRGDVFIEDFETERIMDDEVKALAERVAVVRDPNLPDKDIVHSKMVVKMKGGKRYEKAVQAPLGNPSNPMDMARCREKFEKCLAFSRVNLNGGKVDHLLSMIENLEEVEDVGFIVSGMTA
jgi:2-methylcitrate dehydratase PrpD